WLPQRGRRRSAVTRRVDRRIILHGRLANRATHRPITAAFVIIASEPTDAPGWSAAGLVATDRHGRFRAVLAPGASRRFAALYWPQATAAQPLYSRRLLVRSSPRVYLKITPTGRRRVRFDGHIGGAPMPPGGLIVAVQIKNRGHWVALRTPRTRPTGRFTARYRFSRQAQGATYHVRASVPGRQTAWPLYHGHSRTHTIHIR
ncbi:MAG: hypothetical protein M3296_06210, partial [Actinomycetota bacterium]|nr:hypothetical protein [Actinomycetota bacterium]